MSETAIDGLEELQEGFERALGRRSGRPRAEALVALNTEFHEAVVTGSGNTRVAAVAKLTAVPVAWKCGFWNSRHQREAAVVYHREVIDAIRARDPLRADAVMKSHVYAAKDYFTDKLRRGEQDA